MYGLHAQLFLQHSRVTISKLKHHGGKLTKVPKNTILMKGPAIQLKMGTRMASKPSVKSLGVEVGLWGRSTGRTGSFWASRTGFASPSKVDMPGSLHK